MTGFDMTALLDQALPDACVVFTLDGTVTYWNRGAQAIFGYPSDEALGQALSELIVPADRTPEQAKVLGDTAAAAELTYETVRRRKDGSMLYVDVTTKLLPAANGAGPLIMSTEKDVTRIKVLRDARLMEARFRDLLESTPDGIVMANSTGHIVIANSQAESLFGYGSGELRGLSVDTLLPERYRQAHVGHRSNYFTQPRKRAMGSGLDLAGLRKDGSEFPIEISLSPLLTEESAFVLSAVRDISGRKQFERTLRERNAALASANQELAALNQEIEAFSYSVSHDLRAPLRSMDGFALALLEDYGDKLGDEAHDALKRIRAASQRMGRLIDELLGLSRVTRAELRLRPVDLSQMAREIADALDRQQPERAVQWVIGDGLIVQADPALLQIAMQNLLDNAWKFTSKTEAAVIRVGTTEHEGQSVYFVADNGAGFDMAYADRLFGAFQRLHHESEFPGTGIGLAIVQRIVRRHDGTIWVQSQPGQGATFFFRLKEPAHD